MLLTKTCLALSVWATTCLAKAPSRPNILFIITDDQDKHMHSLDYMPHLQKHLVQQGTTFDHHYCTVAICCPSRVNLWTGQAAHNTNVTDVSPPYGGYPKFVQQGYLKKHLALYMQNSGYNTYYTGKLFNSQTILNYNKPHMTGYNSSEFLLDPYTYQYYNVTTTKNGQAPKNVLGRYSADLTAESGYGLLEEALEHPSRPFFLTVAPMAPHAEVDQGVFTEPKAARRHRHLFKDFKIHRGDNFNPDHPSGVSWIATLPKLNDTLISKNDEYQRQRLRALQSVDEMVDGLVQRLDKAGVLGNTYIFYTADNGYHISQHRLLPGKECGFETDINVPFIVRGPGVARGKTRRFPSSHTDVAPTIMKLARNSVQGYGFDGKAIELYKEPSRPSEHVNVEFWGTASSEAADYAPFPSHRNNTYKGLRIVGQGYSLYYSKWCTNETELYNVRADPGQIRNYLGKQQLVNDYPPIFPKHSLTSLVNRLDALMLVLKSCKESSCREPWKSLHPNGRVRNLVEALNPSYDRFYAEQPKVSFTRCELGYIKSSEGPQNFNRF